MRSNNATRFLLKRNLFVGVIVFLAAFFTLPYWGLAHIPENKASILEYTAVENQTESLSKLVTSEVMSSLSLEMWVILYGGIGFVTAMVLMRHLFSRRQSMLQAALPDKRGTDLGRRWMGYGILCALPIVLNFLLYLLIAAVNGLLPYVVWDELLTRFGLLLLINLYGFVMGMLSSVLTGTYWAALLAGAVLIVGVEGLVVLWKDLAGLYLHTLVKDDSLLNFLRPFSPAVSLYKGLYRIEYFVWAPPVWAILLASGVSFVLYRLRKTEAAEHTLAFSWLGTVMSFILPVMGGSLLGFILELSFGTEWSLLLGMVLGAALTYLLCQIVFNQRFSGALSRWYLLVAASAVLVLGVTVLHTDMTDFDHFMPEREQLTAITYQPQRYHTKESITLTDDDALDAAYQWCTLMRDEADGLECGIHKSELSGTPSRVVVTYHMGDRTVKRLYPNDTIRSEAQSYIQAVINSDDYKQSIVRAFHMDDVTVQSMELYTYGSSLTRYDLYDKFGVAIEYLSLNKTEDGDAIAQWMSALKEDILNRTFEDKMRDPILNLSGTALNTETGNHEYYQFTVLPTDVHFLNLVFGDKAKEIIDYATGGYAADEDLVTLRVTHNLSRAQIRQNDVESDIQVKNITLASSPEEAVKWARCTQNTEAYKYYFMPDDEDRSYSMLYLYKMSELEKMEGYNQFEIPEDKTKLYGNQDIPYQTIRAFIGE